ncbi:unnamed protein product [Gongylonema pulchrum]|uniref:Uncharacterized protein n=1 Tax=Gongylonema pulchrum TaxID=637853 RepID=A0A183DRL0_9BILA|nr:unnamed protein product [Gongylonema pulchrum]
MDPSYRRLSEPNLFPPFASPKLRKIRKQFSTDSTKNKEQKRRSVNSSHGNEEARTADYNASDGQLVHTRRGSETFCGSVAAYSNNLSIINTRL